MKELIEQYIKNYNQVTRLCEEKYDTSDDKSLLAEIKGRNALKSELIKENDELLEKIFIPLESKEYLTSKERTILIEWGNKLNTKYVNIDFGLVARIFRLLYLDSLHNEDYNQIVMNLYYYAYSDYNVRRTNPAYPSTNLFSLINAYTDIYELLTDDGKMFFLRCYGNQILLINSYNIEQRREIIKFFEQKRDSNPNSNIPYDTYLLTIHRNVSMQIDRILAMKEKGELPTPEMIEMVYASAMYINENKDFYPKLKNPDRIMFEYVYHAARFIHGDITIDDLLLELEKLKIVKKDYNLKEKATCYLGMSDYIMSYSKNYKGIPQEELFSMFSTTIKDSLDFIRSIKLSDYTPFIESTIENYITLLISYVNYPQLERFLFTVMSARNLDNGIHCKTSALLCRTIAEYLVKTNPKYFVGVDDFPTLTDVIDKKSVLLDVCYQVGIFHNMGSKDVETLISIEHRSLFPTEMKTVRMHPFLGYLSVKDSLIAQTMVDGILLHHLWADGKNGYPRGYSHTNNKPLVDILSFAIALDSETDFYSRPYQKKCSIEQFLEKSLESAGTHFNKDVVEACMTDELKQKIHHIIDVEKKKLIVEAYKNGMLEY